MRRGLIFAALRAVLLCLALPATLAAAEPEQIRDFHSDITVHPDGSLTVVETILVNARGREIRHGIYRDFPTRYPGRFGTRHTTGFELLSVERDGRAEPWHSQALDNGVRTYIGDRNVLISEALHRYTLRYRSDRQLGFGEDRDQLYWNVTGNQWSFPIRRAGATVHLPDGIANQLLSVEGWTGLQGATETNFRETATGPDGTRFETTAPLAPGAGFTLRLTWPKGGIARPSAMQRSYWFLHDNYLLLFSLLLLAFLPIYYLLSWRCVGRDPERGVVVPTFNPPRDLSPAAMRFITRNKYGSKAFSAAVINIAVKGYLKIVQKGKKKYRLEKTAGEKQDKLSAGERKIFKTLLGSRKSIEIGRKYDRTVKRANDSLKVYLRKEYRSACYRDNAKYAYIGLGAGLLALLAFALHSGPGARDLLFPFLFLTGFAALGALGGRVLFVIAPVAMMAMIFLSNAKAVEAGLSLGVLVMALLVVALFALFNYLLRAPTPYGRKVLDEIEGFRLYLATAEQDRLNLLHPPEKTPELFERYLPYALALDVENQWTAQFSGILGQAGKEGPQYRPTWYEGGRVADFGRGSFATAVGAGLASSVAAASTAPSSGGSGGFGGGGSSGGGGGGGGGGGW